ncbi:Ancient ubiquitous protein 1 [Orchesella cincta]|uniref:Ancient ubiquitous protein 1 n=1 Tax=Orchesella cincta TaxID=48709 RepID=A0A1D2NJM6_ORCCI|nr:Ancient ubiquitous protein 1 [Orchesella cincta]
MGEQMNVEHLFHKSWFRPAGLSTIALILYAPVGICLFVIRVFILLQFFLMALLLPPSKIRQKCLQVMAAVLGMTISAEGDPGPCRGRVFVANHITRLDHLAIHVVTSALKPALDAVPYYLLRPLALTASSLANRTQDSIEASEVSFVVFPEGETTSGEVGLLAFSAVEIPNGINVQPVAIKVSRHWFNTSSVTGGLLNELLIFLFLPNTHFSLRFLPVEVVDNEGLWKQRTQSAIAQELHVTPTKLNTSDKAEFRKKLFFRPPSLAAMARAVQQQLAPQILSPEVILAALQQTGSAEGALEYLRQNRPSAAGNIHPAASTFSKNATHRMMSFQERKRLMIAFARQRYIEKHELQISA